MAGVTDKPFRSFMKEMGCGILTSELVSARALAEGNQKTRVLTEFSERPFGIQIFGEDPKTIGEGAKRAEAAGPDFIDLNLGCPVNKIVRKGAGAALLRDLPVLAAVLKALRAAVKIPVSLKIRTGWTSDSRNGLEVARMAFEEGFSWLTVHGRTRAAGYSGKADWAYIKKLKREAPLPVIGNGDLVSGKGAFQALKESGCDGVMIGRGCLSDPLIFLEARGFLSKKNGGPAPGAAPEASLEKKNLLEAIKRLSAHLEDFYLDDERLFLLQLKKFAVWLSAGFPHSAEFRKSLFQEKDKKLAWEKIERFFAALQDQKKPPPVYEPFLMRGHG